VHAADLHLDSPLRGLSRLGNEELAASLRGATRAAMRNLVAFVRESGAEALLIAGDLYDGDWHDYSTGAFFVEQMDALEVPVFVVSGNHDAASEITRSLRLPQNVKMFRTWAPETYVEENLGLVVHGQGFATRAVSDNLAVGYPQRVPNLVNVGLLHTIAENVGDEHASYAPCSLADLTGLGYEYMALGHVHHRQILASGKHTVAFSGNLQGRHPRETGAKGALLVEAWPGEAAQVTFHELDVARWETLTVDATGAGSLEDALVRFEESLDAALDAAGGRTLVIRVEFTGRCRAAAELSDAVRLEQEIGRAAERRYVGLERVRSRARVPAEPDPASEELRAAVATAARALVSDPERVRGLLQRLRSDLGRDVADAGLLNLGDDAELAELADSAARALDSRLAEAGGGQ
jgi:DNA repair exonuclease SbcCD nuclease subunit